jgi:AcrR family transcriptional regulator
MIGRSALGAVSTSEPALGLVGADSRSRLLAAMVSAVAERGYAAITVSQIAAAAGVSVADFERHFTGKEEAFLAAYDLSVDWLAEWVRAALAGSTEGWPRDLRRAVAATLAQLDAEPDLARLCGAEALLAGPAALRRHRATLARLAAPLRAGRESCEWASELPVDLEQTLLAAAIVSVAGAVRDGGEFGALAPSLTYFLLAPYLGAAEARRLADGG